MKYSEIKTKTSKELLAKLAEVKKEMMNIRFQKSTGDRAIGSKSKGLRKFVARIKTALTAIKGAQNA